MDRCREPCLHDDDADTRAHRLDLSRRRALRAAGLLPLAGGLLATAWPSWARAQRRLVPTPSQTEGPYYPVEIPADSDHDLLVNGTRTYATAHRTTLTGTVVDVDGKPLKGGVVEIWQCDEQGHYHHPGDGGRADPSFQGFGRATIDNEGRYSFVTMKPAKYSGRTPHIHVKVKVGRHELLTTQLYVEGDPGNERDGLWRRLRTPEQKAALTVPFVNAGGGWLGAIFPIVVEA
jgi:protocatechuate 3,4-dioxygenase beta subunit